jgi:hypothetical protein
MFRYRLYDVEGDEVGEAAYALPVRSGEEIIAAGTTRFRVLDVVTEDDSEKYTGLLWPRVGLNAPAKRRFLALRGAPMAAPREHALGQLSRP